MKKLRKCLSCKHKTACDFYTWVSFYTTKDEPVLGALLNGKPSQRGMENKKADTGSPAGSSERRD